jgi:hypothetical protein
MPRPPNPAVTELPWIMTCESLALVLPAPVACTCNHCVLDPMALVPRRHARPLRHAHQRPVLRRHGCCRAQRGPRVPGEGAAQAVLGGAGTAHRPCRHRMPRCNQARALVTTANACVTLSDIPCKITNPSTCPPWLISFRRLKSQHCAERVQAALHAPASHRALARCRLRCGGCSCRCCVAAAAPDAASKRPAHRSAVHAAEGT